VSGSHRSRKLSQIGASSHRAETVDTVCDVIFQLTGSDVHPDLTLEQCGLASVGMPVLIRMLQLALPGLTVNPSDLVSAHSLRELAENLDRRLRHNDSAHIM